MKQYKKSYELKNSAKDRLEGKYVSIIGILMLCTLIGWIVRFSINTIGNSTLYGVYARTGSDLSATVVSVVFELLLLFADVMLGVMNAGVTLCFLKIACGQPFSVRDLFYGYRTDSKKILLITAVLVIWQALCLFPFQYLLQNFLNTGESEWILYTLLALAAGLAVYIPVSLGISLSFYLMFDFPKNSGKETLFLCRRLMKGHKKQLFLLELSFLPLMLLCILSLGIGFLWLQPYMQMTYTYFYLDMVNPATVPDRTS